MSYTFYRFNINATMGVAIDDVITRDDEGVCVLAEEAISRESHNAKRIAELEKKLADKHAKGSRLNGIDATDLYAKLRKLAEGAWPKGPLRAERNLNWAYPQTEIRADGYDRVVMRFVESKPQFCCTIGKAEYEWRNADFFAAASPETVLFLLDHINALGEQIDRLETAYQNVAVTRLNV